ncbi:alpha-L-fucosidase [Paenibacillus taihuensis]|uniref:alpha-L-fucosidase n=1 Tax=Paenibacillus taihuensis TaxID=1156355 RepID=A0A3D9SFZ5_9BACL|nr:alpha-L-fucosidase [Paenibacillus taihuensis]REE94587.1 alpha-L-fucosidase [Paenibacillus taihuensis]
MSTSPVSAPASAVAPHLEWFVHERFGMFIHWGLYAIPARGEWVRSLEKLTKDDYQPFFEEFNPIKYDPRQWAKAAKAAGMKYAVMTAKHHDGFCLFDSKLTDYKATNTPAGRDLIREYIDAFREVGIRVGLYYSIIDWHHEHYPHYGDKIHPMRDNEAFKDYTYDFNQYLEYMHGQVRELLTGYGPIDIMWFDFSYDDMTGEKWRATELVQMMRSIQPNIVIDNRLGGDGKSANPEIYAGDFKSPEQILPPEGVVNEEGKPVPWESCITLNDHWGYCSGDNNYKSPKTVIRGLVECVSKGGNLLLNVGPNALGEIPSLSLDVLAEVGKWMDGNGRSIYGCGPSKLEKPEWGRYTQRGNMLYAHIYDRGMGPINFRGLSGKVKRARLLCDGTEIKVETPWMAWEYAEDAFISFSSAELPDSIDTVVELELLDGDK